MKPFFASHMFIADCNYSMLFHAGDFVNFGQKCVLADLDVATVSKSAQVGGRRTLITAQVVS